ncbi:MAG TPA: hypothetical protein VH639_28815 [Bryobacteraceae bacterium]
MLRHRSDARVQSQSEDATRNMNGENKPKGPPARNVKTVRRGAAKMQGENQTGSSLKTAARLEGSVRFAGKPRGA